MCFADLDKLNTFKFVYDGLVLGLSQFMILLPKNMVASKMVKKRLRNIIILIS